MNEHLKRVNLDIFHMFDILIYLNNNYEDILDKTTKFVQHIEKYYT